MSYPVRSAHTGAYSVHSGCSFAEGRRQGIETDHSLHLVPRLRVSGAVPSLRLCAFMVWTGTAFIFHNQINLFTRKFHVIIKAFQVGKYHRGFFNIPKDLETLFVCIFRDLCHKLH